MAGQGGGRCGGGCEGGCVRVDGVMYQCGEMFISPPPPPPPPLKPILSILPSIYPQTQLTFYRHTAGADVITSSIA